MMRYLHSKKEQRSIFCINNLRNIDEIPHFSRLTREKFGMTGNLIRLGEEAAIRTAKIFLL